MSLDGAIRLARGLDSRTEKVFEVLIFEVELLGEVGRDLLDLEGIK